MKRLAQVVTFYKRAVGRLQDIADVQMLEAAKAREQSQSSEKDKGYGNEL